MNTCRQPLDGRHAFVTGASHGIGLEIALELGRQGAAVIGHGLPDETALRRAQDTWAAAFGEGNDGIAGPAHESGWVTADLTRDVEASCCRLVAEVLRRDPKMDTLVCNAGTFIDTPFPEIEYDIFVRTWQLNVAAPFLIVREFARRWLSDGRSGRVLLVGSVNGRLSEPCHVAYDTSKGAVEAMVRSLCVSLAPKGIRVNGVAPGLFRTPLTASAIDQPGVREWMELHTPNGRVPGPDACAGLSAFLLSDAAEHIHGQMMFVDGGMSAWQQPDLPTS